MEGWQVNIDIPNLLIGAVIGALLGAWYTVFLDRPSLKIMGSGGSSSGGPGASA